MDNYQSILSSIDSILEYNISGKVTAVKGLLIECLGIEQFVAIGSKCEIITREQKKVDAEVVGFRDKTILMMPYTTLEGVGIGCKVNFICLKQKFFPSNNWLGRVIDANAIPLDDGPILEKGSLAYELKASPPPAQKRKKVGRKVDLGVKSVNSFITCCYGQRMGIFAGSGVGKSVLISMFTKFADTDVKIIGLVGERGREVQEFIQEYLGEEGLKKAVVIVATGDESALMRRQAAYLTMLVAEYFRDEGKSVLCIIDNITRFAMAQREIGLSGGEPPSSKGYTPTVFSELPKLLERAGPGIAEGSITGLFAVLVEGDDHNEPIADAVRGIMDGHIVMERNIAERGRFPAINILKSVSRTMPGCNTEEENTLVIKARRILSLYEDMAEMIRLGAYKKGTDKDVDEAIFYYPKLEAFLSQRPKEFETLENCYIQLAQILGIDFK
jgi:flagellum-specific ATP synthase